MMSYYMERFGDYELASVAWFAGPAQAGQILRRGWADAESSIQNPAIKDYVKKTRESLKEAQDPVNAKYLKKISPRQFTTTKGGGSWINPVAGKSEWSGGSWMPNTINHRGRTHAAIDVYADEGTPIVSPVGGKVLSVKTGEIGGHTVRILGDDGIEYYFAHMAAESVAKVGEQINPGFHLGFVGNSGSAKRTKHHLHLSMKDKGNPVSPISYLNNATTHGVGKNYLTEDTSSQKTSGIRNSVSSWAQALSDKAAGGQRLPLPPLNRRTPGSALTPSSLTSEPATPEPTTDGVPY
jgi:murein DD-endopeptidase MepM/ murein hydrolase activator NlpD